MVEGETFFSVAQPLVRYNHVDSPWDTHTHTHTGHECRRGGAWEEERDWQDWRQVTTCVEEYDQNTVYTYMQIS